MKIFSYNIRGLGSRVKRKEIRDFIRVHNIEFCCIQESKLEDVNEAICKASWGNSNCGWAAKDSEGRSGGMISLWNPKVFSCISSWHMEGALIVNGLWGPDRIDCCVINVYAPCPLNERIDLWDRLGVVISQNASSCLCIAGDFNSIRVRSERDGRAATVNNRDLSAFDSFIRDNGLFEFSLHGRNYTYYRDDGSCKSRIDRIFSNLNWLALWPNSYLRGLPRSLSDHCPILLDVKIKNWGPKPFRFFNAWRNHHGFREFVETKWNSYNIHGWGGYVLKEKLKCLKTDLKKWSKDIFGSLDTAIDFSKNEIYKLDILDDSFGLEETEIIQRNAHRARLLRDSKWKASMLHQKSRIKWTNEGDLNTQFFHGVINKRRKRNEISGVLVNGMWKEEVHEVKKGIYDHFKRQFGATYRPRTTLIADFTKRQISTEENIMLTAPFCEDEIKAAVWACDSSKSPGPDGFNMGFFKDSWATIKGDVIRMVEEFHSHGKLVKGINPSFVVLIPKKEAATGLNDYRPISLIGSVYKILSKILANRLSKVLDSLISENQSAFVGERQILDGVAILNEAIDEAKKRNLERLFFKIDFAKAYDSVEWAFIDLMMARFGFNQIWRNWIMECISTATGSILVNGSPTEEYTLRRGLRQGDPLSPFLFLLAAEGLSTLMFRAAELGLFEAAKIGRNSVSVSHLQFADDTVFIGAATDSNVKIMKQILKNMELISGLRVNFEKCGLFGVNVEEGRLARMAAALDCAVGRLPILYLGIKVGVNQKKVEVWATVIQKIQNRLKKWGDKKISLGGRITLINSILASLPLYYLSFYKIPAKTLREIISIQRNFLWGGVDVSSKKISWVKWGNVCKPKDKGGLGVKDLGLFNKALLGKWVWRFLNDRESLWVKVVESRYGREWGSGSELDIEGVRGRWSTWWKDIIRVTYGSEGEWFRSRISRVIGEGENTRFWEDRWAGDIPLKLKFSRLFHLSGARGVTINSLGQWVGQRWEWEWVWRRSLFEREVHLFNNFLSWINRYPLQKGSGDTWNWKEEPNGIYSTKTAYSVLTNQTEAEHTCDKMEAGFKLIWNKYTPTKVSAYAWRVLWDRLPTKINLQKRKIISTSGNVSCSLCEAKAETGDHIFFECEISYKIWMECLGWIGVKTPLNKKPIDNLLFFGQYLRGKKGASSSTPSSTTTASCGPESVAGLPGFQFRAIPDGLPYSDKDATQDIPQLCDALTNNGLPPFLGLIKTLNDSPDYPDVSFRPLTRRSSSTFRRLCFSPPVRVASWVIADFFRSKVIIPQLNRSVVRL